MKATSTAEGDESVSYRFTAESAVVPSEITFVPFDDKPIELIEGVDSSEDGIYNNPQFREGDKLMVTFNEGEEPVEYLFETEHHWFVADNGDYIDPEWSSGDGQGEDTWSPGEVHDSVFSYLGCLFKVPVRIVENQVASFSFTPASEEPYEILADEWWRAEENDDGDTVYYYEGEAWPDMNLRDGDQLTINYIDGSQAVFTYSSEDKCFATDDKALDGKQVIPYPDNDVSLWFGPGEDSVDYWGDGCVKGEHYPLDLYYMGRTCREALSFTVVDDESPSELIDISDYAINLSSSNYLRSGEEPVVEIAPDLDESCYSLVYYKIAGDERVETTDISELGEYIVEAKGNEDEGYTGQTGGVYFYIVEDNNLAFASLSIEPGNVLAGEEPVVSVYMNEDDDEPLDAGCYTVSYFKGEELAPTDDISQPGEYYACAQAIDGKGYTGKTSYWLFHVCAASDLRLCNIELGDSEDPCFATIEELERAIRVVSSVTDEPIDPSKYELAYRDDNYDAIDGTPTVEGAYYVYAVHEDGSESSETDAVRFKLAAENSLLRAQISLESRVLLPGQHPVVSVRWLTDDDDDELINPSNYDVVYYRVDDDDNQIAETTDISQVGSYRVAARAKDGCDYVGMTETTPFEVIDGKNLSEFTVYLDESEFDETGEPIDLTEYVSLECDDEPVSLPDGSYTLVYYGSHVEDEEYVPNEEALGQAPTDAGVYFVAARGVTENGYEGETEACRFEILSATDLWNGEIYLDDDDYVVMETGNPVSLRVYVRPRNSDDALPSNEYTLVYATPVYEEDEDGDPRLVGWEPFNGVPSAPGEYGVSAVANSETYTGQTEWCGFEIVSPKDLRIAELDLSKHEFFYTGKAIDVGAMVTINDQRVNSDCYKLSYRQLVRYEDGEDEDDYGYWKPVATPIEIGEYEVVAEGINGYTGETYSVGFTVIARNDLSEASFDLNRYTYAVPLEGEPFELDMEELRLGGEKVPADAYRLEYYEDSYDEDSDEHTPGDIVEGGITAPGDYWVKAIAVDGKGYKGETEASSFEVVASNSLKAGEITLPKDSFTADEVAQLERTAQVSLNGQVLPSGQYDLVFYKLSEDNDAMDVGDQLESAPTEIGSYYVAARGKGSADEGYVDETRPVRFQIVSSKDLSRAELVLDESVFTYTGGPIQVTGTLTLDNVPVPEEAYTLVCYDIDSEVGNIVSAGTYFVGAQAKDGSEYEGHSPSVRISVQPAKVAVPAAAKNLVYDGKSKTGVAAGDDYMVKNGTSVAAGSYVATLMLKSPRNTTWADGTKADKTIKWSIAKAANGLTAKAKSVKVKAKKVKKKAQKVAATKAIAVSGAQGKVTYKLTKVTAKKKLAKQAKKKIKMAANGQITLKKGLKKGTYKLTVQVSAAGNASYNAATKTVTVKIKVK